MGPFPHHAAKSQISAENPAGTDGFEFVEFAHPEPDVLRHLFTQMGYVHTATHKTRQIELWQQGYYICSERRSKFICRAVCGGTWSLRAFNGLACGGCETCL